jgi:hypothetical protein
LAGAHIPAKLLLKKEQAVAVCDATMPNISISVGFIKNPAIGSRNFNDIIKNKLLLFF